jgi:hypothetical protein
MIPPFINIESFIKEANESLAATQESKDLNELE